MSNFLIDATWAARIKKMWAWQRSFKLTGPGVRASNNEDSFSACVTGETSTIPQSGGSDAGVLVKITGNASGGGKYNGRVLTGISTATASGTLSMPEGLTVPGADDALVINNAESGVSSSHVVTTNQFLQGVLVGFTSGGLKIIEVDAGFTGTKSRVDTVTYSTSTYLLEKHVIVDTYVNGLLVSSDGGTTSTVDAAVSCS